MSGRSVRPYVAYLFQFSFMEYEATPQTPFVRTHTVIITVRQIGLIGGPERHRGEAPTFLNPTQRRHLVILQHHLKSVMRLWVLLDQLLVL